jgi:serine/threonine-protein kinase
MIQVVGAAEPLRIIRDRYRLDALIGEGGMATVWRAWDLTLQRAIAVKLLFASESHTEEALVDRFLREARIAASVQHRNVIHIVDFGTTTEGHPFMVMELLEGETLAARLRRQKPLPVAEVVQIGHLTLRGLAAVHAAGIVHRDLKPENVYLKDEGGVLYPKILDFGISRSIEPGVRGGGSQVTREGVIVGTPEYMSPEQARGVKQLGYRTDLYSMGVMLYEALTGQLPYTSENVGDLIVKIVTGCAPPVHELAPQVPRVISDIVGRAMARLPSDRFADATEMQDALLAASMQHAAGAVPMASNLPPDTAPKLGAPGLLGMLNGLPTNPLPRTQAVQRLMGGPAPANDFKPRPFATTTLPPDAPMPPERLVTEPGYRLPEGEARSAKSQASANVVFATATAQRRTSDFPRENAAPGAVDTADSFDDHAPAGAVAQASSLDNPAAEHAAPSSPATLGAQPPPDTHVPAELASTGPAPGTPSPLPSGSPLLLQRGWRIAIISGPVLMGVAVVALSFAQRTPTGSSVTEPPTHAAVSAHSAPAEHAVAEPSNVHLTLKGVPQTAHVTLDGKPASSVMTVARGDSPHSVLVEAPGKQPWHTSFVAQRDQTLEVALVDRPEAPGSATATKPATATAATVKSSTQKASRAAAQKARARRSNAKQRQRHTQGALRVPDF